MISEGRRYVVDVDLAHFFDTVNYDILMYLISRVIKDKAVLKLIRSYLTAGVMERGIITVSKEGTPQGGPLSPLLSNIMLTELGRELETKLKLKVNEDKSAVVHVRTRQLLGYAFSFNKKSVQFRVWELS